jgi:hypothetical protein
MSRRSAERHRRRTEVRFWRRGDSQVHTGFTIDVSRTGIFLGTSVTLEPGERVRVELMDKENGFIAEGVVARVHKVSLALRHVQQPGVGIRFLPASELVAGILAATKVRKSGSTKRSMPGEGGAAGAPPAVPAVEPPPAVPAAEPLQAVPTGEPVPGAPAAGTESPAEANDKPSAERRADLDDLFGADPAAPQPEEATPEESTPVEAAVEPTRSSSIGRRFSPSITATSPPADSS